MVKYNITKDEQRKLRVVCAWTRLRFDAMAARPKVARELIAKYYDKAVSSPTKSVASPILFAAVARKMGNS